MKKSNLRWRIVVNLAYTPKNLPAAAREPPRRSCFALGGCSRFFGDLALRLAVGLRLTHALSVVVLINFKYTLSRRSLWRRRILHHARRKTRPCRTLHPPIANKPNQLS